MKMEQLKKMNRDEILGALGLASKASTTRWMASNLAVFGVGLLVGASAALLFAPKPGRDLREDVSNKFRNIKGKNSLRGEDEASVLT